MLFCDASASWDCRSLHASEIVGVYLFISAAQRSFFRRIIAALAKWKHLNNLRPLCPIWQLPNWTAYALCSAQLAPVSYSIIQSANGVALTFSTRVKNFWTAILPDSCLYAFSNKLAAQLHIFCIKLIFKVMKINDNTLIWNGTNTTPKLHAVVI